VKTADFQQPADLQDVQGGITDGAGGGIGVWNVPNHLQQQVTCF
jgi:hypothetical protein